MRIVQKNITLSFAVILSSVFAAGALVQPVFAATCGGVETFTVDCGGDQGADAIFSIVRMVILIMTGGIGVLAVGAVVAGAILYTMSGKSPERIKQAKTIWMNTVIGLAIFAFFTAITNFIIPGGVFG